MMVLLAAICCINPKPQTNIRIRESQSTRDKPKAIRPAPNSALEMGIILPRPTTDLRMARERAESRAPMPMAPMRKPRV
jgi:hypothetical protein